MPQNTNIEPHKWARIVIVAYNSGDNLQKCIQHISAQTFENYEVYIVDNNPTTEETDTLNLPDDRFHIINSTENLGFSGGSNLGAKNARTDWIITLNPDAWPKENWLEELYKAAQKYPHISVMSTTLLQSQAPDKVDSFGDALSIFGMAWNCGHDQPIRSLPNKDVEVFSPCGAAAAYKHSAFEDAGGFDESFFCYLEDLDLGFRLRLMGSRCLQIRNAIALHIGSASTSKNSAFKLYWSHKNNLKLIIKNAPLMLLPIMTCAYFMSQSWLLIRIRRTENAKSRRRGLYHSLRDIPSSLKARKNVQKNTKIRTSVISNRLSWRLSSFKKRDYMFWEIED